MKIVAGEINFLVQQHPYNFESSIVEEIYFKIPLHPNGLHFLVLKWSRQNWTKCYSPIGHEFVEIQIFRSMILRKNAFECLQSLECNVENILHIQHLQWMPNTHTEYTHNPHMGRMNPWYTRVCVCVCVFGTMHHSNWSHSKPYPRQSTPTSFLLKLHNRVGRLRWLIHRQKFTHFTINTVSAATIHEFIDQLTIFASNNSAI